jgi:hypothetical protein
MNPVSPRRLARRGPHLAPRPRMTRTIYASLLLGSLACSLNDKPSSADPGGGGAPSTQAPDPTPSPVTPPFGDTSTPPSTGEVPVTTPPEPPPVEPAEAPSDAGAPPEQPAPPAEPLGACCSPHVGGRCADEAITACVCEADPRCCSDGWDSVCVTLVAGLGCGECKGDCCTASVTGGCDSPEVESCVCDKAPECCASAWDDFCVLLAASETASGACGSCPAGP